MFALKKTDEQSFSNVELRLLEQLKGSASNYNWIALLLTLVLGLLFHLEYQSPEVLLWVGWLLLMQIAVAISFVLPLSLPVWARWHAVLFLLGCAGWSLGALFLGIADLFTPITANMYAVILLSWATALQNPLSAQRELALAAIAILLAPWLAYEIYTFDAGSLVSDTTLISMLLIGGMALFLHTRHTHRAHYEAASLHERLDEAEASLDSKRKELARMASRQEEQLYWDTETGLSSLRGFHKRLAGMPDTSSGTAVCIKIHNLDNLSTAFGHDISNAIIADTARKLCCVTRSGDICCRSGSSSFIAFMPGRKVNTETLRKVFELSTLTSVGKLVCPVTIGVANMVQGYEPSAAIKVATSNAVNSKSNIGQHLNIVIGDASDVRSIELQSRLGFDLVEAIESGGLDVVYQPLHDVTTGKPYSFEALARWNHPVLGSISPATFVPIAEDSGQMIPLGNWVMEHSLREFSEAGLFARGFSLSLNISPLQLTSDFFVPLLRKLLERHSIPGNRVTLEITENVFMEDPDFFGKRLRQAKELSVEISLDDFGTGYSSISCLSHFPIDTVKIDRSLIALINTDKSADQLFGSIVSMCQSLAKPVVVEGVETREQLQAVLRHGATLVQGFHYAQGMALDKTITYLERFRKPGLRRSTRDELQRMLAP